MDEQTLQYLRDRVAANIYPQISVPDAIALLADRDALAARCEALEAAIDRAVAVMEDSPIPATCERDALELHVYALWGAIMHLGDLVHPPEVGGDPNGPPPF